MHGKVLRCGQQLGVIAERILRFGNADRQPAIAHLGILRQRFFGSSGKFDPIGTVDLFGDRLDLLLQALVQAVGEPDGLVLQMDSTVSANSLPPAPPLANTSDRAQGTPASAQMARTASISSAVSVGNALMPRRPAGRTGLSCSGYGGPGWRRPCAPARRRGCSGRLWRSRRGA